MKETYTEKLRKLLKYTTINTFSGLDTQSRKSHTRLFKELFEVMEKLDNAEQAKARYKFNQEVFEDLQN